MNYALVIYQNQDLLDVGLTKLSVIKNGGIRIAENSKLCYTRNIQWDNMIVGNLRDVILDTIESQCKDQCIVANESKCYHPRSNVISCWNPTECQSCELLFDQYNLKVVTVCPHYKYDNGTFGPGCTESGEICHEYCLGGCTVPNDPWACHTCKHVEIHGKCADKCPPDMYEYSNRLCLTKEQCQSIRPDRGAHQRDQAVLKAFDGYVEYCDSSIACI